MPDCIFCKIVQGRIKSKIAYETDEVLAFYDVNPAAPIHVLIIPKKHFANLDILLTEDPSLSTKLLVAINEVAKLLNISVDGYRLILNCGENGGQTVQHLHFHLIAGTKLNLHLV